MMISENLKVTLLVTVDGITFYACPDRGSIHEELRYELLLQYASVFSITLGSR